MSFAQLMRSLDLDLTGVPSDTGRSGETSDFWILPSKKADVEDSEIIERRGDLQGNRSNNHRTYGLVEDALIVRSCCSTNSPELKDLTLVNHGLPDVLYP
jgi:hypothetical protein